MESISNESVLEEEVFTTVATSLPKRRAGRRKFQETRHPVYKGVRRRNGGKWVCEVREPNKKSRIWLGTFPTPEMAARAHDVAAMALRGRSACLNFADSAWLLPLPASANAKDVQKAAAEAAEAFRPSNSRLNSGNNEKTETRRSDSSPPEDTFYMDEVADSGMDMAGFLARLAEGVLHSPPPCLGSELQWDDVEEDADMELWSFSV
ncbi:CBF-like protein transcription factor d [Cinnamomum micranthum f. kanehirae]|uniref:CBF-like protein transcription factor d n=1 Tax=Cinnamomum micranthum f. kanehirae TaxID=337451 RepID=A0A3S4PEF2_9MAGN|nr:CBF-like protein transcription factor d [Cinnamomum micranthum f. kanehirae]